MRRLAAAFAVAAAVLVLAPAAGRADTRVATDTWAQVTKTLVVMPGTDVSCWKDVYRSLATNGETTMTAVGDGSYEAILPLARGRTYNYLFFAQAGSPAPGGLMAFNEYYDVVPTSGVIPASTNGTTITNTTAVSFGQAGNFDARRILNIPATMSPGDTLWVFNNFGETPGVVVGLDASPVGDTMVALSWQGPYGFWGSGGEAFKAADVLAGGTYEIYRSTAPNGPYTLISTIEGSLSETIDAGLTTNETYYYYVRCRDAYTGPNGIGVDTFPRMRGDSSAYDTVLTGASIRGFFIVREADLDVIERRGGLAFVSRPEDPPWGPKEAVRLSWVYLPPPRETGVDGPGRLTYDP